MTNKPVRIPMQNIKSDSRCQYCYFFLLLPRIWVYCQIKRSRMQIVKVKYLCTGDVDLIVNPVRRFIVSNRKYETHHSFSMSIHNNCSNWILKMHHSRRSRSKYNLGECSFLNCPNCFSYYFFLITSNRYSCWHFFSVTFIYKYMLHKIYLKCQ